MGATREEIPVFTVRSLHLGVDPRIQHNFAAANHEYCLLRRPCRGVLLSTLTSNLKHGMIIWTTTIQIPPLGFCHPATAEIGILRVLRRLVVTMQARLFQVGTFCPPKMAQGLGHQR